MVSNPCLIGIHHRIVRLVPCKQCARSGHLKCPQVCSCVHRRQRTQGHLADELEQRERHIRTLEQEKARLAVEADDAHALRMSTNRLADQLAERDEVNHRLEAEASRLALEKADLRAAGEAHARAVETELAVSRAKERAFVGARHLHHVGGTRAEIEASRALRSYHAVRSQRLAPADHVSYVRHHRHVSRFY